MEETRPRLAPGVRVHDDLVRRTTVLLGPERVLVPDRHAREILTRCDGRLTVRGIANELAAAHDAPRDVVEHDVAELVRGLHDDGWIAFASIAMPVAGAVGGSMPSILRSTTPSSAVTDPPDTPQPPVMRIDAVVAEVWARRPKACMEGWGRRFLVVDPRGDVLPCHAARTLPGLAFDSVRERSLAAIWRDSSAFERFRGTSWMKEPCRSCDRREVDWGGCRCQALAFGGDATDTDPACELAPTHDAFRAIGLRAA